MRINLLLTNGTKGSQSAKRVAQALSQQLGYKVWRRTSPSPKRKDLRYGAGVDKIAQYKWFSAQGLPSLDFTESRQQAVQWLQDGDTVIARKLTNASCGHGIVVHKPGDDVCAAPVYTKYRKKKREFRVHVFKDKVVAIVEKRARMDWNGERDTHIRNLANGYVFCQDVVDVPQGLPELAVKAGAVVQSDFKGVDIGYNAKKEELFVIEVNSAPGIEGSNVSKYVEAIKNDI